MLDTVRVYIMVGTLNVVYKYSLQQRQHCHTNPICITFYFQMLDTVRVYTMVGTLNEV